MRLCSSFLWFGAGKSTEASGLKGISSLKLRGMWPLIPAHKDGIALDQLVPVFLAMIDR